MDEPRYLIVVGRAEDAKTFYKAIGSKLPNSGYDIQGIHSLDEFSDVDNKDRYIVFIASDLEEAEFLKKTPSILEKFKLMGYGAYSFDSIEEALTHAEAEYDFQDDDSKIQERLLEMRKKFPPFSAEEFEQISIFDSLYVTGKIRPIRARYEDREVVVWAHFSPGADEIRVTPMVMLITDEISNILEVPFK